MPSTLSSMGGRLDPQAAQRHKVFNAAIEGKNITLQQSIVNGTVKGRGQNRLNDVFVKQSVALSGINHIDDVALSQSAQFTGNTRLSFADLYGRIQSTGKLDISHSTLAGKLDAEGQLNVFETTLHAPVVYKGNRLTARDTQFMSTIDVESKQGREHVTTITPCVELLGSSTVKGDIAFKDKKGIVLATDPAQLKGNVINGDLVTTNPYYISQKFWQGKRP
jgi:hypothetical protein